MQLSANHHHKSTKEQSPVMSSDESDPDVSVSRSKNRRHVSKNRSNKSPPPRRVRKDFIKLDRYDGKTPLEAFLIHFNTCSDYNEWNKHEKLSQLKASLRGVAAQVLLGDNEQATFELLCQDLRDNFGTKGLETQYESALRVRRRAKGEDLRSFYQEIHRLVLLAYPDFRGPLRDKLALEAFIEGLNDNDLALKVRNLSPTDLQSAYRTALMLESNQLIVNRHEETKEVRKRDFRLDMQARVVSDSKDNPFKEQLKDFEDKLRNIDSRESNCGEDVQRRMNSLESTLKQLQETITRTFNNNNSNKSSETNTETNVKSTIPFRYASFSEIICHQCGGKGHVRPQCPQLQDLPKSDFTRSAPSGDNHNRRKFNGNRPPYNNNNNNNNNNKSTANGGSFGALKLACASQENSGQHSVYIELELNGIKRSFLLDSGCDMTLIPASYVRDQHLRATTKTVHAANGAEIPLFGETTINLRINNLIIPTEAIISDNVSEGMIGYDWLSANDCFWGFKAGQIMIGGQIIALKSRSSHLPTCCRITVQERTTIPSYSETIISCKAVFNKIRDNPESENINMELATRPHEIRNGLFVAGAIVPKQYNNIPVRLLNTSGRPVLLQEGTTLSDLEPVKILPDHDKPKELPCTKWDNSWKEDLLSGLDPELKSRFGVNLDAILTHYADCFSRSEFDLGRPNLVKHKIDTGNNRPVRQALRRQPLVYLPEIDRQLEELVSHNVIEPAASPWASNLVIVAKKDGSLRMCVDYRG